MKKEFISSSPSQTKKLARSLAPLFLKKRPKDQALIVALEGELGSGKTTFLQGFAKGLGVKEKILSPTFVIVKRFGNFYHIDCYRLKKPKELLDLGFKELIFNPKNILVIEWAEKIKKILPKTTIWLNFEFINEKTRKITIRMGPFAYPEAGGRGLGYSHA